jgi:hypothetical protein
MTRIGRAERTPGAPGLLFFLGLAALSTSCVRLGPDRAATPLSGDPAADAAVLVARLDRFLASEWTIREKHPGTAHQERIWICATDREETVDTPVGLQPVTILLSFRDPGSAQEAGPSGPRPIGFSQHYDVFGLMWGEPCSWNDLCRALGIIHGARPVRPVEP